MNQFADMEVMVVPASHFLGGCVGRKSEVCEFVHSKVREWVEGVECLAKAVYCYPQFAYAAFTHSLSCELTYLQCDVTGCDDQYIPLHDTFEKVFTSALLGREVLQQENELFSLPAKKGGLALTNPVSTTATTYKVSKATTSIRQGAVRTGEKANMAAHNAQC